MSEEQGTNNTKNLVPAGDEGIVVLSSNLVKLGLALANEMAKPTKLEPRSFEVYTTTSQEDVITSQEEMMRIRTVCDIGYLPMYPPEEFFMSLPRLRLDPSGSGLLRYPESSFPYAKEIRHLLTFENNPGCSAIAFSPNSRSALVAFGQNICIVSDVFTNNIDHSPMWLAHTSPHNLCGVKSAVFSADGRFVLSCNDTYIHLWEIQSGLVNRFVETRVNSYQFVRLEKNSEWYPSISDIRELRITESSDKRYNQIPIEVMPAEGEDSAINGIFTALLEYKGLPVNSVGFLPDNHHAIWSAGPAVCLWDIRRGEEVKRFEGHCMDITTVDVSSGGNLILSAGHDSRIRICDVESGKEFRCFVGHTPANQNRNVALSLDGSIVASADDDYIHIWDVESGNQLDGFDGFTRKSSSVHISEWLRQYSEPYSVEVSNGTICHDDEEWVRRHLPIYSVALSPNGTFAIASNGISTILWNVRTGREVFRFTPSLGCTSISPNGLYAIFAGSGIVRLLELSQ